MTLKKKYQNIMINNMDTIITFTLTQLVGLVLAICAAIATISAAISVIAEWITKIQKPEKEQDEKIKALEDIVLSYDKKFKQYDDTLKHNLNKTPPFPLDFNASMYIIYLSILHSIVIFFSKIYH